MKTALLDGKELTIKKEDLPLIIHGEDGTGSSLFSVSIIANLYSQGAKLLFTSGYHMARDEFKKQIGPNFDSILIQNESDVSIAHTKGVIFVPFEHSQLFKQLLSDLEDISERIIFFKNFDLFDASVFEDVRKHKSFLLQGNLNALSDPTDYKDVDWATKIYFSQPPQLFDSKIPELPQYIGFLRQNTQVGIVALAQ